jgi:hypothetical protein
MRRSCVSDGTDNEHIIKAKGFGDGCTAWPWVRGGNWNAAAGDLEHLGPILKNDDGNAFQIDVTASLLVGDGHLNPDRRMLGGWLRLRDRHLTGLPDVFCERSAQIPAAKYGNREQCGCKEIAHLQAPE